MSKSSEQRLITNNLRLRAVNNNVQKQACRYLLFSAYQGNAEVEATESSEATKRQKKLCNSIALVFLLVGASWQGIVDAAIERTSWRLPKYVPC